MTKRRYKMECEVLCAHLPENSYRFFDLDKPSAHLCMAARTNRGNLYTLYIELADFPASPPPVYVTKKLRDYFGKALTDVSIEMHTLSTDCSWTQLCYYSFCSWKVNVSLYKIYIKCRLWLEMYELHLQTGNTIDYYLNHQH